MGHLREALEVIEEGATSTVVKGRGFEDLVKAAFLSHPGEWGKDRFRNVWLWGEWPDREKHGYEAGDDGIDLVAEQTEAYGGGLCAIQCKFHRSEVPTAAVDRFITHSRPSSDLFRSVLLVATAPVSRKGEEALRRHRHGKVLYTADMDEWVDDWRALVDQPESLTIRRQHKKPHPFQRDALDKITAGFRHHDRGQLILPCGTGKTLVALWAAEGNGGGGRATVLS